MIVCAGFHRLFDLRIYWIVGVASWGGEGRIICPADDCRAVCVQRRMLHLWLINVPAIWDDDDDDDNVVDDDQEEDDDDDEVKEDVDHYEQLVG